MEDEIINNIYDRISKIVKNDQKYTYREMGKLVIACTGALDNAEWYYVNYPPLLDIAEIGAGLEFEGSAYQEEMIKQMRYKLSELQKLLPDLR